MSGRLPHPSADKLFEQHAGTLDETTRAALEEHAEACGACRETLDTLAWLDAELKHWQAPTPPSDGLERVLIRIQGRRCGSPRLEWLTPAVLTLTAVLVGSLTVALAGPQLAHHTLLANLPLTETTRSVMGQLAATVILFGLGSLVVLALAPALLLEARRRGSEVPAP